MKNLILTVFIAFAVANYVNLEDLKSSDFGKSLLTTLQVSLKGDGTDVSIKVLSGFKTKLNEQSREAEDKLATLNTECQASINQYNGYLASAKIDLDKARNNMEQWQKPLDQWSLLMKERTKELQIMKDNLSQLESSRKEEEQVEAESLAQFDDAISACEQSLKSLKSISPGSFLQIPIMLQLESQLNSMSTVAPANVPVFQALVELGNSSNDQRGVKKTLGLLEKLRDHISNLKVEFQDRDENIGRLYVEYLKTLQTDKTFLEREISEIQLEVQEWKAKVKDVNSSYEEANRRITDVPKLIEQKQAICDNEKNVLQKDILDIMNQIETIDHVIWQITNKLDEVNKYLGNQ